MMQWQKLMLSELPREGEGTGTGGATTTTTTTETKPWYDGVADSETVGHWQNRGWDKKTAAEVAVEATRAHREAEKLIGAPANEMIRLPKDPKDEAGWKNVWERLGAPKTAADYKFDNVKDAAGNPLPQALVDTLRETAASAYLPQTAAEKVAAAVQKFIAGQGEAAAAERTAKLNEERTALQKEWGSNFEAHKFIAQQAAAKFGISTDVVTALEGQLGYSKTMTFLRDVGMKIGEGRFIEGGPNNPGGLMTRDQALAKVSELKADKAWRARYFDGGSAERREMDGLMAIIAG